MNESCDGDSQITLIQINYVRYRTLSLLFLALFHLKTQRSTAFATGLGYQVKGMGGRTLYRGVYYQLIPLAERSRWNCPIPDIGLVSTAKKAQLPTPQTETETGNESIFSGSFVYGRFIGTGAG